MKFPNACNIFVETYHAAVSPCASVLSNERSGSRQELASIMQKEEPAGQCPSENWMKTTLNYLFSLLTLITAVTCFFAAAAQSAAPQATNGQDTMLPEEANCAPG